MTWRRSGPYSSFLFHCYSRPSYSWPTLSVCRVRNRSLLRTNHTGNGPRIMWGNLNQNAGPRKEPGVDGGH